MRFSPWRIAYHEASHAVANEALGLPVVSVWIDEVKSTGECHSQVPPGTDPWLIAVTLAAGRAGEEKAGLPSFGSEREDRRTFAERVQPLLPDVHPAIAWVRAKQEASALLRLRWVPVCEIALELRQRGRLSGEEVRRVLSVGLPRDSAIQTRPQGRPGIQLVTEALSCR